MNRLAKKKRAQILACLVEGNSIRATVRMTGAAKNTVTKLLCDIGEACEEYQHKALRNLPCKRIQVDEIWTFYYAKDKNVPADKRDTLGYGDVWTWVAICADTKLVPCWLVGTRDTGAATEFLRDLAVRMSGRVQLTSDHWKAYRKAVPRAFGGEVDYAQLRKVYGVVRHDTSPGRRFSPAVVLSCEQRPMIGDPDPKHISTSFAERQNLTMRMSMRRFTRLTNGFSKKLENLEHALALHFMYYNFCRIHKSLRMTPAMAAGVSDHVWELEELVGLLDKNESN